MNSPLQLPLSLLDRFCPDFIPIFKKFGGRHTFFAAFFAVVGTTLAFLQKLDPQFIAFVTVMQGWVFAHSYSQDRAPNGGNNVVNGQNTTHR